MSQCLAFVVKLNGIYQISEEAVSNSKEDEDIASACDVSIVKMESEASARNRNKIGSLLSYSQYCHSFVSGS